ncbi:hypothetical protein Sa4125_09000 [Aureimonas sp. SA4125]|uniref:hypothetical protein n=1 Tax=Aureimonas sp. SA4125 TaxID=2826993 RepID=UPI001CC7B613|nr:hypothetical protein [Aureimonas sp. SA4125]BDA83358.1 hypothetical protein Sa4125_09000 [Aureimonas sp. SA4125]
MNSPDRLARQWFGRPENQSVHDDPPSEIIQQVTDPLLSRRTEARQNVACRRSLSKLRMREFKLLGTLQAEGQAVGSKAEKASAADVEIHVHSSNSRGRDEARA